MQENYLNMLIQGSKTVGAQINHEKCQQFLKYEELLLEWNQKINLTAITDEEGIVIKHFIDSLSVNGLVTNGVRSLIDVGTGAGFPGIPLKIVREDLSVTLLDSLDKRVKFLNEVISQLTLKDIRAIHGRAEDFGILPEFREKFDYAVARAVADLSVLCEYCLPFVKVGGTFIAMKGPLVEEEYEESRKAILLLGGELAKTEKIFLPYSNHERTVIVIRKYRHTPPGYPRKSGKPTKSPIK